MTRTTLIVGSLLLAGLFFAPSAHSGAAPSADAPSGRPVPADAS